MDGLECSEILLSKALTETSYFRLESEYYCQPGLPLADFVRGNNFIVETQYGTSNVCDENAEDGIPVLRLNELNSGFIREPQKFCHTLTNAEYNSLRLKKGDVVVIRTNGNPDYVGKSAVVMEDTDIAFASYLYRVKLSDKIYPEVFVSYLNGKYGRLEIDKNSIKENQTNFSPEKLRDVKFPNFDLPSPLQDLIREAYENAYILIKQSKVMYSSTESLLMSELGIDLSSIHSGGASVKSFSESFGKTGRLDAEYYQGKYDVIYSSIDFVGTIGTLCNVYDKNFVPENEKTYRYIELANIGKSGEIDGVETIRGIDLPTRARRVVKAGDIVVSSIEGSLESCAIITDEYNCALCSTGFYIIDSENYNSETLLVLLKSPLIQDMLKRGCSGTILTSISKDEFLNVPLPSISSDVQKQIAEKISTVYSLRDKSSCLLSYAVKAVEMAIEKDEAAATAWLDKRMKDISK